MSSGKGSLAADVEDLLSTKAFTRCAVRDAIEQFNGADREALNSLLDRVDVPASKIHELLTKHGIDVSVGRLWNHRRRNAGTGCSCPVNA